MLTIQLLPDEVSICRLPPNSAIPDWADSGRFCSVTRTPEELSIVCSTDHVPQSARSEHGFRILKLLGPFPLDTVGVLRRVADPLADAGISILPIGTFDTDYLLVTRNDIERAIAVLKGVNGVRVERAA